MNHFTRLAGLAPKYGGGRKKSPPRKARAIQAKNPLQDETCSGAIWGSVKGCYPLTEFCSKRTDDFSDGRRTPGSCPC